MKELSLRQESVYNLINQLHPLKDLAKRWYLYAGMRFLQGRELTDEQEQFLEEVTDFFLDNLSNIEKDKSFLKKIKLDPIKLPEKKKVKLS